MLVCGTRGTRKTLGKIFVKIAGSLSESFHGFEGSIAGKVLGERYKGERTNVGWTDNTRRAFEILPLVRR